MAKRESTPEACPDGGTCHHRCQGVESGKGMPCFRVLCCGPLSIAKYPRDRWPVDVKVAHAKAQAWQDAHDLFCDFGDGKHPESDQHPNPHSTQED